MRLFPQAFFQGSRTAAFSQFFKVKRFMFSVHSDVTYFGTTLELKRTNVLQSKASTFMSFLSLFGTVTSPMSVRFSPKSVQGFPRCDILMVWHKDIVLWRGVVTNNLISFLKKNSPGWPDMQIIICTINCPTKQQLMVMALVSCFLSMVIVWNVCQP